MNHAPAGPLRKTITAASGLGCGVGPFFFRGTPRRLQAGNGPPASGGPRPPGSDVIGATFLGNGFMVEHEQTPWLAGPRVVSWAYSSTSKEPE